MVDKVLQENDDGMPNDQQQPLSSHQQKQLLRQQQQYANMLIAANQGEYDFEDDDFSDEDDQDPTQQLSHAAMTAEQERIFQMQMQEQLYLEHQQMLEQMTEEELIAFQAQFRGANENGGEPSASASAAAMAMEQQRKLMDMDQLEAAAMLQQQHQAAQLMQSNQLDNLNDYIDEMQLAQQLQQKSGNEKGLSKNNGILDPTTEPLKMTWIQWLCSLEGHEFLVAVSQEFLRDKFNSICVESELPQLSKQRIKQCMQLLLSNQMPNEKELQSEVFLQLNQDASDLYGVLHARYLRSKEGLAIIYNRYLQSFYGTCPRSLCDRQSVIPTGMSDKFKTSRVKIFCPKCEEVYIPKLKNNTLDGAYFGSSLPQIFLKAYPNAVVLPPQVHRYEPKIFGFKIARKCGSAYQQPVTKGIKFTEDEEDLNKLIQKFKQSTSLGKASQQQGADQQSVPQKSQRKKKSAPYANKK